VNLGPERKEKICTKDVKNTGEDEGNFMFRALWGHGGVFRMSEEGPVPRGHETK